MHTINPYRVVTTLAERFAADGRPTIILPAGRRWRGFRAREGPIQVTSVRLTDSELPAKAVVIAAGRASRRTEQRLPRLSTRPAGLPSRGYHVMLAPDNVRFRLAS